MKDEIMETWSRIMSHEVQRIRNESELSIIAQLQQSTWDAIFREELGFLKCPRGTKAQRP